MTEPVIFIGGSLDGELREIDNPQYRVEVPLKGELYELQKLIGANRTFYIYKHESLGIDRMWEKILTGYGREGETSRGNERRWESSLGDG